MVELLPGTPNDLQRVPASVLMRSFQAVDAAQAPRRRVQRSFVSHADNDLDKAVMRVAMVRQPSTCRSVPQQHCNFSPPSAWAAWFPPIFMTLGLGFLGFLFACRTPVLAASPRNCEPRLLLLQMDGPFYVEKQSDGRKPLQYCGRLSLKTVEEDETPWSIVCRRWRRV